MWPVNKKKYILFLIILPSLAFILLGVISFKYTFKAEFSEKTIFSEGQTKQIYDVLDIDSSKANIEKLTYSHAKDSLFMIYINNLTLNDIVQNYSEGYSDGNKIYCKKNDDYTIKCVLYKESGKDIAIFRIENYNEHLYNMVKKSIKYI